MQNKYQYNPSAFPIFAVNQMIYLQYNCSNILNWTAIVANYK